MGGKRKRVEPLVPRVALLRNKCGMRGAEGTRKLDPVHTTLKNCVINFSKFSRNFKRFFKEFGNVFKVISAEE